MQQQGQSKPHMQNQQLQMFWHQQNQEMEQLNGTTTYYTPYGIALLEKVILRYYDTSSLAIKGYVADDDFILGRVYFFACSPFQRKPASQSCC